MIIKADAADLAEIGRLNHRAYRDMSKGVPTWNSEEFFHTLVAKRAQHATFFVLKNDNRLIGSVAYSKPGSSMEPVTTSWASILLLAVHPEYRGNGYGRLLAKECISMASSDQAETIGLFTSELMTTAHQLYKSLGFQIDHELEPRLGLRYWLYRYDIPKAAHEQQQNTR